MNLTPINRRILRTLTFWHNPTYQELSDTAWDIALPTMTPKGYQAIYLDGQLDKVKGVATKFSQEYERVTGAWKESRGTKAYVLRNAHLANGFIYKRGMKMPLLNTKEKMILSGDIEFIDMAVLTSSYVSNVYFAHFIVDELPLTIAGKHLGEAITVVKETYSHESEYRNFFDLHSRPLSLAKVKELTIIDDISFNDHKANRFHSLRSKLRTYYLPTKNEGVYFRRGLSGSRRLLINEKEVEDFLEAKGFAIIDPQSSSVSEIMKKSLSAPVIAGVEGSQISPGLLSVKDNGAILTLQPPDRFNAFYKVHTDGLGLNYSFVVGDQADGGFEIDLIELEKTLDLISLKI